MINAIAYWAGFEGVLNLFRYITFRSMGALVTALVIALLIGPRFIGFLRQKQGKGQPIREDGPASHLLTKKGTPTMGGLMILIALTASTLLWMDMANGFVWVPQVQETHPFSDPIHPLVAAWFPNAVFLLLGIVFLYLRGSNRELKLRWWR